MPLRKIRENSRKMENPRGRPSKWKIREPQPLPRKSTDPKLYPLDPKDRPKKPGITYPRKKEKIITDPEKKKRYQDLLDKSRMTESEKRNLIKRRAKRTKEGKEIIRKKYNIGGRANLLEEVGRLDAEKMNPNRRAEKKRVIGELNKGYKGGGMEQRGLGRAFMKGGKV